MLKHYSDTGPLLLQNSVIGHSVIGSMSDKTEFHIPDTIKLLDISIDKDAVAFVTEDDKLKVFTCIEMDYFKESDTIDLTSTGIPLTDNYAMFLSVSSRGEYVVISYFDMDTYGNAKAAHTNKCVVFKQGAVYFQTKCNGRAVFIKKDRLALIDLDKIKILNSQFQQEYFLDLYPLIKNCEMVVGPINEDIKWRHLCKQVTYHDDREASLLVNLSRHIRSDVLVTVNQATFAFIWLISDGTLLSSFKIMPDEEILAIAKNTQSIATYDKHNSVVRIYDAKNGLVVNHLKISPKVTEDIEFTVSYLRFCDNGRYLLIVGLEKSIREKDIIQAITFEFWHIVAEKLIYRNRSSQDMERVESNTEWTNMILPFVIADAPVDDASLPKWHAIHSVRESPESDAHKIIKKEFSLNESLNERLIEARGWKHNSPNIVFYGFQSEIVEALDKQDGFVCFSRAIETANGPIHILVRFGAHTVQMWKVDQGSDPGDLDKHELMYIRAYKTLQPNSSYTFRDDFTPYPDENGCTDVKVMMNNDGRMRIPVYKKSVDKPNDMLDFTCVMEEIILPIEPEEFSFHTFESVCSALYYLYRLEDQGLVKENSKAYRTLRKNHMLLYQKTLRLAQAGLRSILKTECNYFATYSGSQTMAKLACFSDGWDILQMVMTDDDLPLVIFSHKKGERLWENVLTVLLEHTQYDLFHYLFNRVIRDAEQSSLGTTSVLLDVLLYLQDQGNRDLLLQCSRKLSYLRVDETAHPVLRSGDFDTTSLRKRYQSYLRDSETYSSIEEIDLYDADMIDFIWFQYDLMVRDNRVLDYLNRLGTATKNLFVQRTAMVTSTLCVVPLLHFNSYYDDASEDNLLEKGVTEERTSKGSILTRKYQNRSLFTNIASSAYNNQIFQQEDTVMEIMLNYKWREFARWRFSVMMIIHVIYYLSYSFAVSFPQEAYGYQPGLPITHPLHVVATVFMFLTVSIFLLQEVRQCLKFSMLEYITSAYNWIDLAAYSLTITTFLQMRYQSIYMLEVGTIAILLLWTHAILRLRIIRPFGKTLEIIIQLFKEVFPMLFIMIVVIIAFTHSFIFLLRQQPEEYFQEQYDGSTNNETILAMKGTSGGNSFTNFLGGFPAVWFFIHGIWDPIMEGEAADNPMVVVLSIAFSFVMVFIFFNMVIAIMSATVEKTSEKGDLIWTSHFAAVLSEIEVLWCSSSGRHSRRNNPIYIYYIANQEDVLNQKTELEEQSNMLLEKLKRRLPRRKRRQ